MTHGCGKLKAGRKAFKLWLKHHPNAEFNKDFKLTFICGFNTGWKARADKEKEQQPQAAERKQ